MKKITKTTVKKSSDKEVIYGIAHVKSSYNNTIITVTDIQGGVLSWSSAGNMGFKGSKKSTPYAAQIAAEDVVKKVQKKHSLKNVDVFLKGAGGGRDSAVRALASAGLKISSIKDVTPRKHGGCRPRKARRV